MMYNWQKEYEELVAEWVETEQAYQTKVANLQMELTAIRRVHLEEVIEKEEDAFPMTSLELYEVIGLPLHLRIQEHQLDKVLPLQRKKLVTKQIKEELQTIYKRLEVYDTQYLSARKIV